MNSDAYVGCLRFKRCLPVRGGARWIAVAAMMMGTIDAGAQQDAALSAKVIAWASQNIAAFQKAADYAHHKQHPRFRCLRRLICRAICAAIHRRRRVRHRWRRG